MTLLKILAYSLFGYVLYELYLGITEGVEAKAQVSEPAKAPATKSIRGSKSVSVQGTGGSRTKRTVGRGVV